MEELMTSFLLAFVAELGVAIITYQDQEAIFLFSTIPLFNFKAQDFLLDSIKYSTYTVWTCVSYFFNDFWKTTFCII